MTQESAERLIAIIEERTRHMFEESQETKREMREIRKEMREGIQRVHSRLDEEQEKCMLEREKLYKTFVSHDQFWPIRTIVYGATGLALVAFMGAILALVIKR